MVICIKEKLFLNSITQLKDVNDLWIIRLKSVSTQFGASNLGNEVPKIQ